MPSVLVSFLAKRSSGDRSFTRPSALPHMRPTRRRQGITRRLEHSLDMERLEPRQLLAAQPIITEFMANNDGAIQFPDGSTPDWIELHNAGDAPIDLVGHRLTDDRADLSRWTFPSVNLSPGQYSLVYASGRDETDSNGNLHANFRLRGEGEYLALTSPAGTILSEYASGAGDYPEQLSDVTFGTVDVDKLVGPSSPAAYWVPTHGNLGTSWTEPQFDVARNGFQQGTASLGYETQPNDRTNFVGQFQTELPANSHAVYARMEFDVNDRSRISDLVLRLKYDEGFIAYLNGIEVARSRSPDNPKWYSTTSGRSRPDSRALEFEQFQLFQNTVRLVDGTNVLAVHALNGLLDRGDMLLVAELFAYLPAGDARVGFLGTPTAGGPNHIFDAFAGPLISDVTQNPRELLDQEDLLITARVTESNGPVDSVFLHYRVMFDGEVSVQMVDDGTGADLTPRDGTYSAIIPHTASNPGDMVRWRVTATDVDGNAMRWPLFAHPTDSDEYFGTVVVDSSVQTNLPVVQWFVKQPAAANTEGGTRSSIFFDGRFYDNVRTDVHGQNALAFPKKSYDVDFNNGNRFQWAEGEEPVRDINLISNWTDKGKFRTSLGYEIYRDAGAAYMFAFPVRVQQNGEFFSVVDLVEDADDRTLQRLGLNPDGALYKMNAALMGTIGAEKKTRKWEDLSDLQQLASAARMSGEDWERFAYDNLDIPAIANYLAVFDINSNRDCCHKEYYLYRDTGASDEWQFLPWDLEMSFGRNWKSGPSSFDDNLDADNALGVGANNSVIGRLYEMPQFREMYLRRLRSLVDQFIQPPDTPYQQRYLETRMDELIARIDPHDDDSPDQPAQGTDDADLDYQKWGSWDQANGRQAHAARGETMREHIARVKTDFLPARREFLYSHRDVPAAQAGSPRVDFGMIDAEPVSGEAAEEYVQLVNPNDVAVDISGWRLAEAVDFTFSPGTVIPTGGSLYVAADKNAFRGRSAGPSGGQGLFAVGGFEGELSAAGEPLSLINADGNVVRRTFVGNMGEVTDVQRFLRISELNYAPHGPNPVPELGEIDDGSAQPADAFEFIELTNTGTTSIDVSGVSFGAGVKFTFAPGTTVDPGAYIVVVKERAAFESRYGTGLNVAGQFSGSLSDRSEGLFVDDANGRPVTGFRYNQTADWPGRAAGNGSSLQVIDSSANLDDAANWQASAEIGGSPGVASAPQPQHVVIHEVLPGGEEAGGDKIELFNTALADVNIGNWYIGNGENDYFRFQVPILSVIAAGGYAVFDRSQLGFDIDGALGDQLWLIEADSNGRPVRFVDHVEFGSTAEGISLGPWPGIGGAHLPLTETTFGAPNTRLKTGDVVITEFQYNNPTDLDHVRNRITAKQFEYVELYNQSMTSISLAHWRLAGSIDLLFPPGTSLGPGQTLIAVGFDPVEFPTSEQVFRFYHNVPSGAQIIGPYTGDLDAGAQVVRLEVAGEAPADDPAAMPFIVVDEVDFGVDAPWPFEANGSGRSLSRTTPADYGNVASSWIAAVPSPGASSFFERIDGDANDDGQFDQRDIVQVLAADKYRSNEPAGWSEGDWNADEVFDQLDIIAALQSGFYRSGVN